MTFEILTQRNGNIATFYTHNFNKVIQEFREDDWEVIQIYALAKEPILIVDYAKVNFIGVDLKDCLKLL